MKKTQTEATRNHVKANAKLSLAIETLKQLRVATQLKAGMMDPTDGYACRGE